MQFGKSIKADRDALAPLIRLLAQHGDVPHALEHPSVRIDDIYSMGELLGFGQIGKVYRGKHRLTGEKQLRCALSPYADRLSARVCVQRADYGAVIGAVKGWHYRRRHRASTS